MTRMDERVERILAVGDPVDRLTHDLVALDRAYTAESPSEAWERWYANRLLAGT